MTGTKLVIFDFDGTLVDNGQQTYEAMRAIFRSAHATPPSYSTFVREQAPPWTDFYHKHGLPRAVTSQTIWDLFLRIIGNHHPIFNDVYDCATTLKKSGLKLALVTSQSEEVVLEKLAQFGCLLIFDHMELGCTNCKRIGLRRTLLHLDVKPEHAIYVGDLCYDVTIAWELGLGAVAINRYPALLPYDEADQLFKRHGATMVIENLHQLEQALMEVRYDNAPM